MQIPLSICYHAAQKTLGDRVDALQIATRPARGGASGALDMTNAISTDDGFAMRPIDVELYEACAEGTFAQVKALLDKGADPNAIHWLKAEYEEEYCGDHDYPVFPAAEHKDPRILELLLAHGADPNVMDGSLLFPVAFAAKEERYRNVERLLKLGNDPNVVSVDGDTACSLAANNKTTRVLKSLLSHGADPNIGGVGWMPLENAVQYGTPSRVRFFIQHGTSPQTCHAEAICLAPVENVKALLECGFDPNTQVKDEDGNRHPIVDDLSGKTRTLFLRFGAKTSKKE